MSSKRKFLTVLAIMFLSLVATVTADSRSFAAQLQLNWSDNSTNEDGFKVERSTSATGTYSQIAQTGANVTTYMDSNLTAGATYCYRLRSYNAGGNSPYSNTACATISNVTHTFTVNLVNSITNAGAGNGTVTSSPAGIDCGQTCSAVFNNGTSVTLTAQPASDSTFTGWSGACKGNGKCTVKVKSDIAVTASFAPHGVTLAVKKGGNGNVVSAPSGIDCGPSCTGSYLSGSTITLTPNPDPGFLFLGWSGGGCSGVNSCTVVLNGNSSVTAKFSTHIPSSIGVFRPGTGQWLLDLDGNGAYGGCSVDSCVAAFGQQGDLPTPGAWGTGETTLLGFFDSNTAAWHLDLNGNEIVDACEIDSCIGAFGQPGDLPVGGDWNGKGVTRVGVFRPSTATWYFDINGDGDLDSCTKANKIDACTKSFGKSGDLPVVGDWKGNGKTRIGVYRPSTGQWFLDRNGNRKRDDCSLDKCAASFGLTEDLPVVGDWNGNGKAKIGVFRPSTGEWLLDFNGNETWDGCEVDLCLGPFGQPGDLPVVGKW
jgi:hypothetical protein